MEKAAGIFVAGTNTLLGDAIVRRLDSAGYAHLVGRRNDEPDLTDTRAVDDFFASARPEYVFMAAGKSGGIAANTRLPAELMRDNLLTATHVIHSAYAHGARKLLYLASSCSYPRHCPQPMQVEHLLTGPFEPTNEAYAIAKVAGIKLCQAYRAQYGAHFIVCIPPNSFGPRDDFSSEDSHVIGALMRRMHEAKVNGDGAVTVWGTGKPRRGFLYADDVADACVFVMQRYDSAQPINLGGGPDLAISELAERIKEIVGYEGKLQYDTSKPDGMPLKRLDSGALAAMGWSPKTSFRGALQATYDAFRNRKTQ